MENYFSFTILTSFVRTHERHIMTAALDTTWLFLIVLAFVFSAAVIINAFTWPAWYKHEITSEGVFGLPIAFGLAWLSAAVVGIIAHSLFWAAAGAVLVLMVEAVYFAVVDGRAKRARARQQD